MNTEITPKQYFKCKNGVVLTSLLDLINEFDWYSRGASSDTFQFHLKNNENDYANWIRDVLKEPELAEKVRASKDPFEVKKLLQEKAKELKNPEKNPPRDEKVAANAEALLERTAKIKGATTRKAIPDEKKLDSLKELYDELNNQISENRKQGKDVFLPALSLRNAKSKMGYFEASADESSYKKALSSLEEVKKELQEAIAKEEINVKKEVMEKVGEEVPSEKKEEKKNTEKSDEVH